VIQKRERKGILCGSIDCHGSTGRKKPFTCGTAACTSYTPRACGTMSRHQEAGGGG
jgi:hypothetical protein